MNAPDKVMTPNTRTDSQQRGKAVKTRLDEFNTLTKDIQEISKRANDPFFLSMLIHQLTKEREQTNKLLTNLEQKYDDILFFLKNQQQASEEPATPVVAEILSEADQRILGTVEKRGQVTAQDVQTALQYKGVNAASQRLNKLFREGYLKKIRAGRKVVYLARQ